MDGGATDPLWVDQLPVIVTGVVGLAGILATAVAGVLDRRSMRRRDVEARAQERKAQAYIETLDVVNKMAEWARTVRPVYEFEGMHRTEMPSVEEQMHADVRLVAYGSAEAIAGFQAWRAAVDEIVSADARIAAAERTETHEEAMRQRQLISTSLLSVERKAREEVTHLVARELGSRRTDPQKRGGRSLYG